MIDYRLRQRQARLKEICRENAYPWLMRIGELYKESGAMPLCLGDFYEEPKDKEVAEVLSVIAPDNEKYLLELRNMIGKNPWKTIQNRDFTNIAKTKHILGAVDFNGSDVFNMLDWIWEVTCQDRVPLEYAVIAELGHITPHHSTPINELCQRKGLRHNLEMLLVKMTLKDGFGVGMWDFFEEDELSCPMTPDMRNLLRAFYPIEKGVSKNNTDEIIRFIGFEKPTDFLYSYWAFKRAMSLHPKEVTALTKKIGTFYRTISLRHNMRVTISAEDSLV